MYCRQGLEKPKVSCRNYAMEWQVAKRIGTYFDTKILRSLFGQNAGPGSVWAEFPLATMSSAGGM